MTSDFKGCVIEVAMPKCMFAHELPHIHSTPHLLPPGQNAHQKQEAKLVTSSWLPNPTLSLPSCLSVFCASHWGLVCVWVCSILRGQPGNSTERLEAAIKTSNGSGWREAWAERAQKRGSEPKTSEKVCVCCSVISLLTHTERRRRWLMFQRSRAWCPLSCWRQPDRDRSSCWMNKQAKQTPSFLCVWDDYRCRRFLCMDKCLPGEDRCACKG